MARIYVASSWRNQQQPHLVALLREHGHEVYDFRNPPSGINGGFRWSELDPNWEKWDAKTYRENLYTPLARRGFKSDLDGMRWADIGVLLLPCGRSAHLELGWMAGMNKRTVILTRNGEEPELMALLADQVLISTQELFDWLPEPTSIDVMVREAEVRYQAMSTDEKAEMWRRQREIWTRQDKD